MYGIWLSLRLQWQQNTNETLKLITEYMQQFQPVKSRRWDSDEEEGIIGEVLKGVAI
jgi:hypothetical protein